MDRIDCSAHSRVSSTRRLRVLALVPSVSYGIAVAAVARADRSLTDAIVPRIDRRTAVVATSNCHWTDGSFIDLRRVGAAARTHGAALVVDASQSLGAYPFDVTGIQPDFLVTVGYKWLLGPYALGYLYVAERWHERGVPIEESWLHREGSENLAARVNYSDTYKAGAALWTRRVSAVLSFIHGARGTRADRTMDAIAHSATTRRLDGGTGGTRKVAGPHLLRPGQSRRSHDRAQGARRPAG